MPVFVYSKLWNPREKLQNDELFKFLYKNKERARDLVEEVLPGPVLARLDLESIRVHDVSYLDDDLARHFSDLVLGMNLKDSDDPVDMYCLLEHKSRPARFVGLQLLRYMALRWTECLKNKPLAEGRQPSIIPVVIYQGGSNWRVPASFHELAHFPPEDFNAYAPDFVFEFFDIPRISDDRLRELKHKAFLRFYLAMPNR